MSLRFNRMYQLMTLQCDGCGHDEQREGDYREALDLFKGANWGVVQEGREWRHYCPACNAERREQYAQQRGIFG